MNIKEIIINNEKILDDFFAQDKFLFSLKKSFLKSAKIQDICEERIVIATGHQPVFYYPGIIFKNYFVSKTAKELNGVPLNFIVDTDIANINVPVPGKHNENYYKKYVKIENPEKLCYALFKPHRDIVKNFFVDIEKIVKTLNRKEILRSFRNYTKQFFFFYDKNKNFVDTNILLRQQFEKLHKFPVMDLKFSSIAKSTPFYNFVYLIIKKIEEFIEIYNNGVKLNIKKKRYVYQPVKLLHIEKNIYELPFWYVDKKRHRLFIEKKNHKLRFLTENNVVLIEINIQNKIDSEIINIIRKKILIFPKAVILTMIARLFFCDLFIHGTGGAVYDRITDYILKNFFKLKEDLKYLIVTGNIYLPFEIDIQNIEQKYNEKKKWLNEVKYHPEKFMDKKLAEYYITEKQKLLDILNNTKDTAKRKEIHNKIKAIHQEMTGFFKRRIELTEEDIKEYEKILKQKDVFLEREYPYFFYPEDINFSELLEKNLRVLKNSKKAQF